MRTLQRAAGAQFLFCVMILLPALLQAESPVSVSILSILQPTELTITLQQPDRAMLRADSSQNVILARVPVRIQLQKDRLSTDSVAASREITIECTDFCIFELKLQGLDRRQYKGNLRLTPRASTISIVLLTDESELLSSIVASEMGEYHLPPVLQAFAVVARSFLNAGSRHPDVGADFCDLTHCQVFQSYAPAAEAIRAVRDTTGLVLTYKQKAFRPFYFRSCGGTTATFEEVWGESAPDYPFTSMKCPCNVLWDTALRADELSKILGLPVRDFQQSETGLLFRSDNGNRSLSAEEFRIAAGRAIGWKRIRSNSFVARHQNGTLILHGKGIGHRVGFCQNGAFQLAQQGQSFQEILHHYFPNTEIRNRK